MQVLIISVSLYVLLNQLNGDKGALFLPEARHVCLFNCYHYALSFAYQFHKSKSYQGINMSCMGTTEGYFECNALLLQLSCYEKRL